MSYNTNIIKYINQKTCDIILKKLTSNNLIGKGFWGSIYKFEIKDNKIAIKIQPLYNDKLYDSNIKDPRNIDLEIQLLKQISNFKINNNFIHFPYFYSSLTCQKQSLIFYEYYPYNLTKFFNTEYTFESFKSIIYQCIITIYYFQKITEHFHNDIHIENFLLNEININELQYSFFNYDIKIKLYGYYISIWDFANAIPIYKTDNNIDILQLKLMFSSYIKKYIYNLFSYPQLYGFCIKNEKFKKYYDKSLFENKIKWKHISNVSNRTNHIEKSVKKAMIYWIIEERLYLELIKDLNLPIYFPVIEMLDWIDSLPNNIEQCLDIINN